MVLIQALHISHCSGGLPRRFTTFSDRPRGRGHGHGGLVGIGRRIVGLVGAFTSTVALEGRKIDREVLIIEGGSHPDGPAAEVSQVVGFFPVVEVKVEEAT